MVSDEALKKLQEQIAAWPMERRFVVQQLIEDYRRNREDLRAYKATGLTPKRCAEFARADAEGRYIVMRDAEQEGVARLRELAEADKDGRLVVLPCKVGDTVYRLQYIEQTPGRFVVGVAEIKFALIWLEAFGETVFLTREDAEKALKAMNNGKVFQNCRD